jgi:hypothetical protein
LERRGVGEGAGGVKGLSRAGGRRGGGGGSVDVDVDDDNDNDNDVAAAVAPYRDDRIPMAFIKTQPVSGTSQYLFRVGADEDGVFYEYRVYHVDLLTEVHTIRNP